jgi:hypothetical protein
MEYTCHYPWGVAHEETNRVVTTKKAKNAANLRSCSPKVFILILLSVARISIYKHGNHLRQLGRIELSSEHPIRRPEHSLSVLNILPIMLHNHDDRGYVLIEGSEEPHNILARLRVEVACDLVGKDLSCDKFRLS